MSHLIKIYAVSNSSILSLVLKELRAFKVLSALSVFHDFGQMETLPYFWIMKPSKMNFKPQEHFIKKDINLMHVKK